MQPRVGKILLTAGNAFAFATLVYTAFSVFYLSPFATVLLLLIAYDQLEDILNIKPHSNLLWVDILYEIVCCVVGFILAYFGYTYYRYFYSFLYVAVFLSGIMIIISSMFDLLSDIRMMQQNVVVNKKYWLRA